MAAALPQAAITSLERSPEEIVGQVPLAQADPKNSKSPPSALVLALKSEDRPFELKLEAVSLGGDLVETNVRVIAPSGKLVREIAIPRTGGSAIRASETLPADGETGMYRVEFRCREAAINMPVTNLEAEVILWPKNQVVRGQWLAGELFLAEGKSPIELRIESTSDKTPAELPHCRRRRQGRGRRKLVQGPRSSRKLASCSIRRVTPCPGGSKWWAWRHFPGAARG